MNEISVGKKEWSDLLARHDFFFRYKFYLCIVASTKGSAEDHLKWSGMVESKLRILVQKLEATEGIVIAHPYFKTFEDNYVCKDADEAYNISSTYGTLKGEEFSKNSRGAAELNEDEKEGEFKLHLTKLYIGLDLDIKGAKSLDIQGPCSDFFALCKAWTTYDETMHLIIIKNVKLYDLPSDVYVEGEERPVKPAKRKRVDTNGDIKKKVKNTAQ